MTRTINIATRTVLGLVALALASNQALAVSPAVESACASDYLAYCSQHPTEGPGVRACMRANGLKLSMTCVNALVAAANREGTGRSKQDIVQMIPERVHPADDVVEA